MRYRRAFLCLLAGCTLLTHASTRPVWAEQDEVRVLSLAAQEENAQVTTYASGQPVESLSLWPTDNDKASSPLALADSNQRTLATAETTPISPKTEKTHRICCRCSGCYKEGDTITKWESAAIRVMEHQHANWPISGASEDYQKICFDYCTTQDTECLQSLEKNGSCIGTSDPKADECQEKPTSCEDLVRANPGLYIGQ